MSDNYSRLALEPQNRQMLAAMEHGGKTVGNWAQMTPIAIKDLRQQGYFANYTDEEILANPKLYEAAVAAYWDKGRPVSSVPESQRGLWWLNPNQYRKTDGDIDKVKAFSPYNTDAQAQNVFRNRLKNSPRQRVLYNQYRASKNSDEASSLGSQSESLYSS